MNEFYCDILHLYHLTDFPQLCSPDSFENSRGGGFASQQEAMSTLRYEDVHRTIMSQPELWLAKLTIMKSLKSSSFRFTQTWVSETLSLSRTVTLCWTKAWTALNAFSRSLMILRFFLTLLPGKLCLGDHSGLWQDEVGLGLNLVFVWYRKAVCCN